MRLAGTALLCVASVSCATIIRGTKQDFTVQSEPAGASAALSTGQTCDATPCTFELPRKVDFDVTVAKAGYKTATAHVTSGWSRGGTQTFIVGNLILGGLPGMGVDASTGAVRDLHPNPLMVTLEPEAAAAPAEAASTEAAAAAAEIAAAPTTP
jgi:hypothetical protein